MNYFFYLFSTVFLSLFFSYECNTKEGIFRKYPQIRSLPSEKFFVILNNGIFIYENDFSNFIEKYKFTGIQTVNNEEDNNKTAISEIEYNNNFYIVCLVKNFLYLYDNNKESITTYVNLTTNLTGKKYNLNTFINNNKLSCIISFIQKSKYNNYNNIYKIYFYKIDNLNDANNIIISNYIYFNEDTVKINRKSYITDFSLSCQIIENNILLCFYLKENSKYLQSSGFYIYNNCNIEINYDSSYTNNYIKDNINSLKDIKASKPFNTSQLLVCYERIFNDNNKNGSFVFIII